MYAVDSRDKVIVLPGVPQCDVGASLPAIIAHENHLLLAYLLPFASAGGTQDRTAVVAFGGPVAHLFGPPNDETLHGHPLYPRGLQPYAAFTVKDSSWVRALERMNRVHPSHDPARYDRLVHYVFVFHDSTFECVAQNFRVSEHEGSVAEVLMRASSPDEPARSKIQP